jgi:hypothetical protein
MIIQGGSSRASPLPPQDLLFARASVQESEQHLSAQCCRVLRFSKNTDSTQAFRPNMARFRRTLEQPRINLACE